MFKKKFTPELFKQMRVNAGLSREDLAMLMGWSEGTVVNYEKSECKMQLKDFEKFMMVTTTTPADKANRKKLLNTIANFFEDLTTTVTLK
jgi:DNA-binding XRE family transcriptional regulator|tara:strand:- start:10474 stop:10743 length:270 start_codon:yes stop_codon:yes gene_type:complete